MTDLHLKRAYEPGAESDGFRVYIDRLWPRGLSHETFPYDLWEKEIAPSTELREWFHTDPDGRWQEFEQRYSAELKVNSAWSEFTSQIAAHPVVTLIYSSHNENINNAIVVAHTLVENDPAKFRLSN